MMSNRIGIAALAALIVSVKPVAAQHVHEHGRPVANDAAVERQLDEVRRATERYRDHAAAVADGFKLFGAEGPLMGEHWYHPDRVREPFDLARPSTLQYAWIDGKRQLIGVAYTVYRRPGEPLPEGFEGVTDAWHVHDVGRIARALTADRPFMRWLAERRLESGRAGGGDGRTQLTMVHAWPWLANPDGPFAQQHRTLPYLRAGLPASFAVAGDDDGAWGVSLLNNGSCTSEIRRVHALARLSSTQRTQLSAACTEAASTVRAAFQPSVDEATLNSAASAAWKSYTQKRDALLTPEQLERMGVTMEHSHGNNISEAVRVGSEGWEVTGALRVRDYLPA
ncbi:MAG: hypothetical protein ACREMQ_14305 [Longimicrobiales bacterium]